jgi:divalent metal cation (Fe/Co/Zn/Cd) transporter
MPIEIAVMITVLVMLLLIGTFILAFPITKRLGRIMEEWIALRRDSMPEREALDRIETAVESIGQRVESVEQRMDLVAERQDFMESLMETERRQQLGAGD